MLLISAVLAAGFACQWIAWRVKIPAILPLIAAGLLAGPIGLGILHPQEQLGELYFPIVSLSVAIILFEGSLTLNFREVRNVASVVRNLLHDRRACFLVGRRGGGPLLHGHFLGPQLALRRADRRHRTDGDCAVDPQCAPAPPPSPRS